MMTERLDDGSRVDIHISDDADPSKMAFHIASLASKGVGPTLRANSSRALTRAVFPSSGPTASPNSTS